MMAGRNTRNRLFQTALFKIKRLISNVCFSSYLILHSYYIRLPFHKIEQTYNPHRAYAAAGFAMRQGVPDMSTL